MPRSYTRRDLDRVAPDTTASVSDRLSTAGTHLTISAARTRRTRHAARSPGAPPDGCPGHRLHGTLCHGEASSSALPTSASRDETYFQPRPSQEAQVTD
jgi:hypothetical protein